MSVHTRGKACKEPTTHESLEGAGWACRWAWNMVRVPLKLTRSLTETGRQCNARDKLIAATPADQARPWLEETDRGDRRPEEDQWGVRGTPKGKSWVPIVTKGVE